MRGARRQRARPTVLRPLPSDSTRREGCTSSAGSWRSSPSSRFTRAGRFSLRRAVTRWPRPPVRFNAPCPDAPGPNLANHKIYSQSGVLVR